MKKLYLLLILPFILVLLCSYTRFLPKEFVPGEYVGIKDGYDIRGIIGEDEFSFIATSGDGTVYKSSGTYKDIGDRFEFTYDGIGEIEFGYYENGSLSLPVYVQDTRSLNVALRSMYVYKGEYRRKIPVGVVVSDITFLLSPDSKTYKCFTISRVMGKSESFLEEGSIDIDEYGKVVMTPDGKKSIVDENLFCRKLGSSYNLLKLSLKTTNRTSKRYTIELKPN